jgi:hypothetical protein
MLVQELIRELQKFDQNAKLNYVNFQNKNIPITDIKIYYNGNYEVCFYFKSGSSIIG